VLRTRFHILFFLTVGTFRYASKLLNENKFQNPRAGKNDDKAHPPITPCRAVDPNTISDHNQRQIYILIVKHYLACCSRDALGKETEIITQMGSEIFTAKGLMITEHNWLEIYKPWERWGTGQGLLPTVDIGSKFVPSQLMLSQGRTAPPTLLSEAELIGLMVRQCTCLVFCICFDRVYFLWIHRTKVGSGPMPQ